MDKVFDAVNRADAEALVVHGRFLQEKFGSASNGGSLDVGGPAGSAPLSPPAIPSPPSSPEDGPAGPQRLQPPSGSGAA
jgi:hypothetical protein